MLLGVRPHSLPRDGTDLSRGSQLNYCNATRRNLNIDCIGNDGNLLISQPVNCGSETLTGQTDCCRNVSTTVDSRHSLLRFIDTIIVQQSDNPTRRVAVDEVFNIATNFHWSCVREHMSKYMS